LKKVLYLISIILIMLVGCKSNSDKVQELNKFVEEKDKVIESHKAEILDLKKQLKSQDKKIKELEALFETTAEKNKNLIISPEEAENIIKNKATQIINLLKEKNIEEFATYVHPTKGVRFTPYTTVSMGSDKVFTKDNMKQFFKDQIMYLWGYYDGSGENILLKPNDYYERFVYDEDYVNAEIVSYNEVMSRNNNLENQFEIYPNSIIVEYYFSGFNPDYSGLDWKSLRIVFRKENKEWYVVGIIHNEWTI